LRRPTNSAQEIPRNSRDFFGGNVGPFIWAADQIDPNVVGRNIIARDQLAASPLNVRVDLIVHFLPRKAMPGDFE
jgi:hypothetical protein